MMVEVESNYHSMLDPENKHLAHKTMMSKKVENDEMIRIPNLLYMNSEKYMALDRQAKVYLDYSTYPRISLYYNCYYEKLSSTKNTVV